MTLRRRDRIAGRFRILGDPEQVLGAADPRRLRGIQPPPQLRDDDVWLAALDRETGARVRVQPRGGPRTWPVDLRREEVARRVGALDLTAVVPILHVGPGVIQAEAPPARRWPTLPIPAALACALEACEVIARCHALGLAGASSWIYFGRRNLRLIERDGAWRVAWILPGLEILELLDSTPTRPRGPATRELPTTSPARSVVGRASIDTRPVLESPTTERPQDPAIARDALALLTFFFTLAPAAQSLRREPGLDRLRGLVERGGVSPEVPDVAALARIFLDLLSPTSGWSARVEAMPRVPSLAPFSHDLDVIIADGEAQLRRPDPYLVRALAGALHQRACRSAAAGDLPRALTDVEHAVELDPMITFRTTHAVLLDRLGRFEAARREIDAAFADPAIHGPRGPGERALPASERARVHLTRGVLRGRAREWPGAIDDLRRAEALLPTALHARHLGAALYAAGDLVAAAEAELQAVLRAPDDGDARWALIVTLVRLGRVDEAHAHAEALVQRRPGSDDLRARLDRLLSRTRVAPSTPPE
ncbi:MAG: hypothetical protein R3B09_26190 [Nannocystaceae bacterium]